MLEIANYGNYKYELQNENGDQVAIVNSIEIARLFAAASDMLAELGFAVKRIEIANTEGDPILSAWLPGARAAIKKATVK